MTTTSPQSKEIQNHRTRKYTLKKFGLTLEDEQRLLAVQHGVCAICKTSSPGKKKKYWSIDHDHQTGEVRGLLCHNCNCVLGHAKDSQATLISAAQYLSAPPISRIH